jgi:hypothetical protein
MRRSTSSLEVFPPSAAPSAASTFLSIADEDRPSDRTLLLLLLLLLLFRGISRMTLLYMRSRPFSFVANERAKKRG